MIYLLAIVAYGTLVFVIVLDNIFINDRDKQILKHHSDLCEPLLKNMELKSKFSGRKKDE